MRYNPLGRTGVKISAISLGTALFGVAPREDEADSLIGRALDLGINVIDTANSYGNQARFDRPGIAPAADRKSAETIVGRAIRGRRDRIVLCSKVMERVGDDINDGGLSRRHIMAQVDASLQRLGTDHLDIYYAHHPDPETPLDETIAAFGSLIRQGKIRYWALSTYPAWQVMQALWICDTQGVPAPVCVQVPYNLAGREVEADLVPLCRQHGISLTVFSPLAGGLLADTDETREFLGRRRWGGPGFSESQLRIAAGLKALAREHGRSAAELALGWLISRPAVASAIIGPETIAELDANAAGNLAIDDELLRKIDLISTIQS